VRFPFYSKIKLYPSLQAVSPAARQTSFPADLYGEKEAGFTFMPSFFKKPGTFGCRRTPPSCLNTKAGNPPLY
jgi:hypothetical protein